MVLVSGGLSQFPEGGCVNPEADWAVCGSGELAGCLGQASVL